MTQKVFQYQNVQLFITSKNVNFKTAICRYSLHDYINYSTPKIPINLSMTFN